MKARQARCGKRQTLSAFNAAILEEVKAKMEERAKKRSAAKLERHITAEKTYKDFEDCMARRGQLTLEERLQEDGQKMTMALKRRLHTTLTLQETPQPVFRRAQCRAGECLYSSLENNFSCDIRDEFRVELRWDGLSSAEYYHVRCMECMIPLQTLARLQFKLDGRCTWSLMIGKWMEHRGCIDVDLIVSYIERDAVFVRRQAEMIDEFSNIELRHQISCTLERPLCGCPEMPRGPKVPVLRNYVTDKSCTLWSVMCHQYALKGRFFEDAYPPWRFDPVNELESEADSKLDKPA